MNMRVALVGDGSLLTPAQADEPLPWWSFGKTVIAAAALSLVRDGLLELDEAVAEGPFTLRQLLRHEAGLADYGELADYHAAVAHNEAPWPVEEMLQRLDAKRLRYTPGTGWRYSNVGYLYVTRLIERAIGLTLGEGVVVGAVSRPKPVFVDDANAVTSFESIIHSFQDYLFTITFV